MELKTYSDWSLENNEADPAERIRSYADYVRTNKFKDGGLNEEVEQGITDGVAQLALKEGIVSEDMAEDELNGIIGDLRASKKTDPDADAKLLLDHYSLDLDPTDPEVAAKAAPLRRYLTMRRMAPEKVETDGVLDAVNPLLSDPENIRAARKAAVDRGDLQLAAVDETDGTRQIYTGPNTTREMVTGKLDSLIASGAIRPGDLPKVEDFMRPLFGGATTTAEFNRGHEFSSTFSELAKKDPTLMESLRLDADNMRRTNERALRSTGEAVWYNTKNTVASIFDTLVATPLAGIIGTATDAAGLTEGQGAFADKKAKPYVPRNVVEILSRNEAIRNRFTPEEIEKFGSSLVQRAAGPAYRADRPGSGITADAMGAPIIADALIPNKSLFDKELEGSSLNEEQKAAARLERDTAMDEKAPTYLKMITGEDDAAVAALAQHRASGGNDAEFVEKWLSDPKNYNWFSERSQQLGSTVAAIVPQLALAIPSLLGHEGSTKAIIAMQKDQQDRQQYAQLFGDEFGMGFDILNTIPQVATDVLATIGTGAIYAGFKGVLRGGVRAASRAAVRSTVSTVSREAAALAKAAATAGNEATLGIAFKTLGKEIGAKLSTVEKMAPVGAVAFTRSAGASYAQIYNQLDPKLSHAEKHEKAVGYAIAAGIGTALTTMGMSMIGMEGVERLATGGIRPWSLGDDLIDDATQTVKASGVRRIQPEDLNYKQAKLLYESTANASKAVTDKQFQAALRKQIGSAWKNYFRTTLKGGWDEGLEETIDQGIQMKMEDAALDKDTPIVEKADQYWKSFVLGGSMGTGSSGVSQLVQPLNRNEVGMALDARMSILGRTAAELRKTGNIATAEVLSRELNRYQQIAGERAAKEAAEREKAEADKAAGIEPEVPSDKRFDDDMEKGTFLGDLDGSFVHLDGEEGRVVVEDGNAFFVPQKKKFKAKKGEIRIDPATNLPVADESYRETKNRVLLGAANQYAAGIVTNLPTLPRTADGHYYVTLAGSDKRYRLPTVEEFQQNPEAYFNWAPDADGNVTKIHMTNLPGLDGPYPGNKLETSKHRIRQLANRYGLDIEPRPPVVADVEGAAPVGETPAEPASEAPRKPTKLVFSKGGQAQFGFVEGKLPDVPYADPSAEPKKEEPGLDNNEPARQAVAEIDQQIARRESWIKKLRSDPAQKGQVETWKAEVVALKQQRAAALTPEYTDQNLPPTPEYLWDEAMGFLVENTNRKLLQSKYADTGDVETNAQVLDLLVDSMMNKDWGANPKVALREFDALEGMDLDTLEETADVMQSFLENPPEGLPPISPEMRKERFQWVDDFRQNIGLARRFMADRTERQMIAEALKAGDTFQKALLGDRNPEGWLTDIAERPEPTGEPVIEDADDDGSDVPPEDTPPPAPEPLADRVNNFLSLLGNWQDEIRAAAERADASNPSALSKQEREAKLNELVKTTTKRFINGYGAELYSEIQQSEALAEEARTELLGRIAAADAGYKSLIMRVKPTTRTGKGIKKPPQTFLTPKNTRWSGTSIKRVRPEFYRKGTKEQALFEKLVAHGASPGWKASKGDLVQSADLAGIGRAPVLQEQFNTTINGNVFTAFSNSKVDHISDGGTFTNPNAYLAAKNRQLAEEVRARYPETGTFFQTGDGWGFRLNGDRRKATDIKTKTSKISGVYGILVPYTESIVNGELTLTGVFTNNPAITRAQLAEGMRVPLPSSLKGKPNPSILVEDGVVKGTYLPEDLNRQSPVLAGENIPLKEAFANRTGVERFSDARRAGELLFESGILNPANDTMFKRHYEKQLELLYRTFGDILHANRAPDGARSPRYPFDTTNIDDTLTGTARAFTQKLNEYRLAQRVTNSLMNGVRSLLKKGAVASPAVESYLNGDGTVFADLDTAAQKELLKGAAAKDVVTLAGHSNVVAFMLKHFDRGLSTQEIADAISLLYDGKFAHGDPEATLLEYARYLFTQTTSEKGKFRTRPVATDVTNEFRVIANRFAAKEKRPGRSVDTESFIEGDVEAGMRGFMQQGMISMFDTLNDEGRAALDGLMGFSKTRYSSLADIQAVNDVPTSAGLFFDDALMGSQTIRHIAELEKTISESPDVEKAFYEIAKRASVRLSIPGLASLRGVSMVRELSRHLADKFDYSEGKVFLQELNKTPSGRRAAALMIVEGWLPPYTVREKGMRWKSTNLPLMTPSDARAAGVQAPAATSAESPDRAITEGEQVRKAIFTKTKEDIEKREAGIYGVDEGGLYLVKETRQQESEYNDLYNAAVANLQEDLRDMMEERNAFSDMTELALREMEEAEADLAALGMAPVKQEGKMATTRPVGRELPMTRRDAVENSEAAISRMLQRKATRIAELNEEGDRLEARAEAVSKAHQSVAKGGYHASIAGLWSVADSYPDNKAKAKKLAGKPASFAAKYGIPVEQAEEYYAAKTNTRRREVISKAADALGRKHTFSLLALPQFTRDLRAQAKIKFDQAAEMTRVVEGLSKLPVERTVLQVLSKWEQAKNTLKSLEADTKLFSPEAREAIRREIKRLETLVKNPAYPQLKELLYNHPSTIEFIMSRRPDYQPSDYAKELIKKHDQAAYEKRQAELLSALYPAGEPRDFVKLTFRSTPTVSQIGGQIDAEGNVVPTMASPDISDPPIFTDWETLKGEASRRAADYLARQTELTDAFNDADRNAADEAEKAARQRADLEAEVVARWEKLFAEEAQAIKDGSMTTPEWIEMQRAAAEKAGKPLPQEVLEWDRLDAIEKQNQQNKMDEAAAQRGDAGFRPRLSRTPVAPSWQMPFASMSTIDPALRDAANEANTEEMNTLGLKDGDSESMIGALQILRQSGPPHHKLVADILLAGAGDYVRTVNLVVVEMDNGFAGLYDRDTNTVILNLNEHNGRGLADVLLHELLHGATVNVLSNPRTAAQRAAAARISQLRQLAANLAEKQGVTSPAILHGLESDAEFVSYALTAPEFQSLLKGLALPEQRNVWQRLLDRVLEFFGLDPAKFIKQRSAVEELLDFAKMGMAHRRTFTTDLRWDQHEADRVNETTNRFNYHADRLAMEKDGVFAAKRSEFPNQPRIAVERLKNGAERLSVVDDYQTLYTVDVTAANKDEEMRKITDQFFKVAMAEDVANLSLPPVPSLTEIQELVADARNKKVLIGKGGNADVYATANPNFVLRVGNGNWNNTSIDAPWSMMPDRFPGHNFGQAVAGNGRVQLLRKQEGVPAGLDPVRKMGRTEPGAQEFNNKLFAESIIRTARMPQSAYDALAEDIAYLPTVGGAFDPSKANNVLLDVDRGRFNIVDVNDNGEGYRSGFSDMVVALMDNGNANYYRGEGAMDLTHMFRMIWDKSLAAARKAGLEIRPDTSGDLSARLAGVSAENLRFAMPAPGTGDLSVDPQAELESMMPPGMAIVFDNEMIGAMGTRRRSPDQIRVHPEHLANMVQGLRPDKARAVIRATLDEELAELAADTVMDDDDYATLAAGLSDRQRSRLENSYFGHMVPDAKARAAKIAELRESGQWTDADLGREWFRQHVTRMALGSTREQVLDYKDSNPGLFQKILDAITNYISVLKDRLAASFTNGTAARISQASRELRRLRNDGVLPDPERAPAGEYGDTTAFLNMLDSHEVTGQEDRTRFALPVYGEDAKVGGFWKAVRSRFYDMAHPELKAILDIKSGTNKAVEYTMVEFNRRFPQMRDAALAAGFTLDDILLTFGTTAPMVSMEERAAINKQLKAEGLGWKKSQFDETVRKNRETRERELYDDAARRMASDFRIRQQDMEDTMRAHGLGEMVDFIIENRNILNRFKVEIGFGETNDVYLTRTYRYFKTPAWAAAVKAGAVFTDPETGETVDFGALRKIAADEMFKDEVLKNAKKDGKRLTDAEVGEKVMERLDEYLRDLDKRALNTQSLDGVVMLRKDLNLLKTKKDIDFPLRHLLGEVKDPFEVYLRTLHNVSRYASNETFLRDFTDKALELGFASYEAKDGMELLFPARKEPEYDKLAGLYVRKDVANAIRDEFLHKGPSSEPNGQALITKYVTRPAAWIAGASLFAKTSPGVGYWIRNMVSNVLLTTAQGLNPFSFHAFKAAHVAWKANMDVKSGTDEAQRAHIRRLTELQIVRDDFNGRMALDLMHGFAAGTEQQLDDMLKAITQAQTTGDMSILKRMAHGTKVPVAWNWLVEGMSNLNNFVDSFPKINAYYQELASLRKSYGDTKPDAELEALAARKVKLVFPTHSQQLSVVKAFNKSPLGLAVIPFLRYKTEVLRTMVNTPGLILEELQSGNPNEVARGVRRLVGFSATVGGGGSAALSAVYMGVNAIIQSLAGGDDDDEDSRELTAEEKADIRLGMPDWQREHDFIARRVGNRIQMVDMTYALPHSMVADLVKIGTEGFRTGRAGAFNALARYISGEVLGANIAFSAGLDTALNKDDYGKPIALETDSWHEGTLKLVKHFTKNALAPSIYSKGEAILRKGETKRSELILGEVLGGRAVFHDTPAIAERMLRRIANTQKEAVSLRQVIERGRYFDPAEVGPQLDKFQAALNKNQLRLHQALGTLRNLGMTDPEIYRVAKMDSVRLSADTIRDATNGTRRSWTFSPDWARKVTANKAAMKEQEAGPVLDAVAEWVKKNPGFYPVVPEDE